mmetsp:Transcript_55908/g.177167  ORF Transcript_55908/g.177167 Transcript_55908/m.177167 type:complete len:237 (-) Transcript_55908:465-1175(-)
MACTSGRVGTSAEFPRQLCFWRMQRENCSKSSLSYDTMQRYEHTWSLSPHSSRQSRPFLHCSSATHAKSASRQFPTMHVMVSSVVSLGIRATSATYRWITKRKQYKRSSELRRPQRSLTCRHSIWSLASRVKDSFPSSICMGLMALGLRPLRAVAASSIGSPSKNILVGTCAAPARRDATAGALVTPAATRRSAPLRAASISPGFALSLSTTMLRASSAQLSRFDMWLMTSYHEAS